MGPMPKTNPTASDPGPDMAEVKMHLHGPANPCDGVVVSNERCTGRKPAGFVRHIAFDVTGTQLAGNFRSGQSFGVLPPGVDGAGRPHKLRLYSISSPTRGEDGQGRVVATTVKRTIDEHYDTHRLFLGVASNYLCDLAPGDRVQLTGPSGKRFVLPARPEEHDYVFFATGTGIAPFRGMVMDLLSGAAASQSRIVLVMGAAFATDLLYDQELLRMASEHTRFRYITAISRERQEDGHGPLYVQDRLKTHREELGSVLGSDRGLIYICGLAGMELGIFQRLAGTLDPAWVDRYLRIDPAVRSEVAAWHRGMIPKQVSATRRVFVEVY